MARKPAPIGRFACGGSAMQSRRKQVRALFLARRSKKSCKGLCFRFEFAPRDCVSKPSIVGIQARDLPWPWRGFLSIERVTSHILIRECGCSMPGDYDKGGRSELVIHRSSERRTGAKSGFRAHPGLESKRPGRFAGPIAHERTTWFRCWVKR